MKQGYWGDISSWVSDNDIHNRLFRFWHSSWPEEMACSFVYITQVIQLPGGDFLIGTQEYDDSYDDCRYPSVDYNRLSEITLAYYERDQEE